MMDLERYIDKKTSAEHAYLCDGSCVNRIYEKQHE